MNLDISSLIILLFKYKWDKILHPINESLSILFKVDGKCTSINLKQSANASASISSTPSGITILSKPSHFEKVLLGIFLMFSDSVISFNSWHL